MKIFVDRFWERTRAIGCLCIEWTGYRRADGYGEFRVGKRKQQAHRIAWELTFGPIPDGLWVLHKCNNRWCVNPDHLFLGTHARGEAHKLAKLNEMQVKEIRSIIGITHAKIAKRFGINRSVVTEVRSRRTWRHVV